MLDENVSFCFYHFKINMASVRLISFHTITQNLLGLNELKCCVTIANILVSGLNMSVSIKENDIKNVSSKRFLSLNPDWF